MKHFFRSLLLLGLLSVFSLSARAQPRSLGARNIVLDDGAGHTLTIQPFAPMTSNQTFTFPSNTSYTPGSVLFADGNGAINQNNSKFFWDRTLNRLGIGTTAPVSPLHIVGTTPDPTFKDATNYFYLPDPVNHILTVENTSTSGKGNGIAIIIHNPASSNPITDGQSNNEASNYLTFYNDVGDHNHIRGRVESFSYQNFNDMVQSINSITSNTDIYNPFNYFTCNLGFDTHFMDNSFNGSFLNNVFTLPTFPTLNDGSWPTLSLCDLYISLPDGIPNVDLGNILPCGLTGGSWPSLSGGSVGSIDFNAIQSPINFGNITSPITNLTNPFSVNYSFIDGILDQVKGVPYKQKVIDIFSSGPKVAIVKAIGTYAMAFFAGGVTYESGSGDYAEWLERANHDERITAGDVVGVVGGKITKNTDGATQYMIASFKPCVLGNMPEAGKEQFYNKVAFMGQVPVKMMCAVKAGDYIVPDGRNNGFAKAVSPESVSSDDLGNVLGVAWASDSTVGFKLVNIAVGLKPNEVVKVVQDQQKEIDQLRADVAAIKSRMGMTHLASHHKTNAKRSKEYSAN